MAVVVGVGVAVGVVVVVTVVVAVADGVAVAVAVVVAVGVAVGVAVAVAVVVGVVVVVKEHAVTLTIGIDPGAKGGIAWSVDGVLPCAVPMPATERDIADQLTEIRELAPIDGTGIRAYLEKVGPMPRKDKKPCPVCKVQPQQGVASTAKFLQHYGTLRGILVALRIPFVDVNPGVWCRHHSLVRRKNETNTAWKNRHKALAQQHAPHLRVTHATADAILICEFGAVKREIHRQGLA